MLEKTIPITLSFIDEIKVTAGHFILGSNNKSLSKDAYLQGFQSSISSRNAYVTLFPSLYVFRNIPNIPDGEHSNELNYTVLHLGTKLNLLKSDNLSLDFDYYQNIENYTLVSSINNNFKEQKTGFTIGLKYGNIKLKNDWFVKLTYANLERYSILDYMAQNDWARWDYSSFNSPDGRLSNFQGIEVVFAYSLTSKINLVSKYYLVEQLIPTGIAKETGQRIRFDIDIKI